MNVMAKAKFEKSGQIIDSGVDLNMEGGIAEYVEIIYHTWNVTIEYNDYLKNIMF